MRLSSLLTTFLAAVLISACGGGGGSPGLSSGSVSTFSVVAPATLTLQTGLWQSFAVRGGVKPYSVFSTDPAVASGWFIGDDVVAVGAVVPGKATMTVTDAKGAKFDIALTSGSSTAFFMTAPAALTITPGAAYAQTFTLGGGTGPYVATSSFPSVATVSINGNQMTITGVEIGTESSTITIRDQAGAVLTTSVTAGTIPLAVNPTAITAFIGDKLRGIVTGGTRPYRVQVSIDEAGINARILDGNILEVVGGQVVSAASVTVIDANNQSVDMKLTLSAGQDVLRVQPNALTVPESGTTPDITLMVYGASVTGGIQVFTTNTGLLNPVSPVKNADGTGYAVRLAGGNTCSETVVAAVAATVVGGVITVPAVPAAGGDRTITITVIDAKGKTGTSTITVKDTNGKAGC